MIRLLLGGAFTCGLIGLSMIGVPHVARNSRRSEQFAVAAAMLATLLLAVVPASYHDYDLGIAPDGVPDFVWIPATFIPWSALAVAVCGMLYAISAGLVRGQSGLVTLGLVYMLVILPVTGCARFVSLPNPWIEYGTLDHPNGERYAFLNSSFMQGQALLLARVTAQRWHGTAYEGIGLTNGDSPRAWLPVVRQAAQPKSRYPLLLLAPDGRVVAIRSSNHCYMVYDPRTKTFYGHNEVRALSPFMLLDARSAPDMVDVDETLMGIDEVAHSYANNAAYIAAALDRESLSGFPSKATLDSAIRHENPAVPGIARRFIQREATYLGQLLQSR